MKRRKVPHLNLLISHFGESRLLEILSKENSLQKEIDELSTQVSKWYYHFDAHYTALILSYAFETPSQAFILLQVCHLFYRAFNTKLFWQKFLDRKYANIPDSIKTFFTPFHHLVWPKYKALIVVGKVATKRHSNREEMTISGYGRRLIEFTSFQKRNGQLIAEGRLFADHSCGMRLLHQATAIYSDDDFVRISKGRFCTNCNCLLPDDDAVNTNRHKNGLHSNLTNFKTLQNYRYASGTLSIPGAVIEGHFINHNDGYPLHLTEGRITTEDGILQEVEVNWKNVDFWQALILGLKEQHKIKSETS